MTQPKTDPTLAEHMEELAIIAHELGADKVWLLRGAREASLAFTLFSQDRVTSGVPIHLEVVSQVELGQAGVMVMIRFPASDGGPLGVQEK